MSIKVHLPDNYEYEYSYDFDAKGNRPEINKRFVICSNSKRLNEAPQNKKCFFCYNCAKNIIVEKTEDDKEIWIEFT